MLDSHAYEELLFVPIEDPEPGRLARAKRLPIEHMGERKYKVGAEHYIDLDGETPCHCADALLRGTRICKHYLAAVLYEQSK